MEHTIVLNSNIVVYTLCMSKRARRIRLAVYPGGKLTATLPHRVAIILLEDFMRSRSVWILEKIAKLSKYQEVPLRGDVTQEYKEYKEQARILVEEKIAKFNQVYNFTYTGIAIKNQKTLWGSCSKQKKLNFNYKIALLPEHLAEYIVVHELCHLGEFNHSSKFWDLVAKTIPNHTACREALRKTGLHFQ